MVVKEHRRVISLGFVKNNRLEFEDESGQQYSLPLECCKKLVEIDSRAVSTMVLISTEYGAGIKPAILQVIGQTFD